MPESAIYWRIALTLMLALWTSLVLAADYEMPVGSRCMSRKDVALLKQTGHSGGYICDGTSFRFLGRVKGNAGAYLIYLFRYALTPEPGTAVHSGQRLIVFDGKGKYLGQYALSADRIMLKGTSIYWRSDDDRANAWSYEKSRAWGAIELGDGPPAKILVYGELNEFYK